MPIKNKDFGKYKRPGIFIEEIDNSVVNLPVQDVLINLVPGFSKKGPVNSPIYVTNPTDFEAIFGEDDRRLENKGSFFHKTVKQMLKNGPVWALNLLATDPNRDKVDWQSISVSAQYENGIVNRDAYESFFNRQSFWERDTDSFLNVVKTSNFGVEDAEKLFHITNMGDTDITVFMFKSDVTGFDVSAEEWYGSRTKVPAYIDYREWISDYLVEIVVLAGDWSDYATLANDTTYGEYFNKTGLIKDEVDNFLTERTLEVLGKYDCSLIPYFKDLNDRDMYIKNVINNNTDKTGLFCTYNEDSLLGADYKLGNVDVIGDSIVADDKDSITYMSYDVQLKEELTYSQQYLDSANNVFCNNVDSLDSVDGSFGVSSRSSQYTNGHINQIYFNSGSSYANASGCTVVVSDASIDAYYVLNGVVTSGFTETTLSLSAITTDEGSRYDVLYLSSSNAVYALEGVGSETFDGAIKPDYNFSLDSTIILGYVRQEKSGATYNMIYYPVSMSTDDTDGYVPVGTVTNYETLIQDSYDSNGTYLNISFEGTAGQSGSYDDYHYLRQAHAFNEMVDNVSDESVLVKFSGVSFDTGDKEPINQVSFIDATSVSDSTVKLYCNNAFECYSANEILLYYTDNEFLLHENANTSTLETRYDTLAKGSAEKIGIVAKYSTFYEDYYNGIINNFDYFYINNDSSLNPSKILLKMYTDTDEKLTVKFLTTNDPETLYEVDKDKWDEDSGYNFDLIIHSNRSNWEQSVEIEEVVGDSLTTCQAIKVNKDRYSEITKGSFLAAYYDEAYYGVGGEGYLANAEPRKLTRVIKVQNDPYDVDLKILYTDAPIKIADFDSAPNAADYQTFSYNSIDVYVDEYKALKLSPFVIHKDSIPDNTDDRMYEILDVISYSTNLAKGLADKNKISWRYLVDSFGLGLQLSDSLGSKQQLVDLAGMKGNCISFISMPSAKIFRESTNPSFVNDDYSLNLEYLSEGADDSKNPDFYYAFGQKRGEIDGRSNSGYFFPYVRIFDNGIPKWMPPASYAATTYMNKFTSNVAGLVPWTIAAGITNGRINNITKTEMDFTEEDQEYLFGMNANPIVYKVNNGYCLNSESSAQVFPYSSLSLIHSREVLIELENRMYDMLLRYQWQFNTAEIRAEIKYRADKICKDILDNDGLYDFWNTCDETNNDDYVIDLQMGVLDTYVEIIKGMGIIVNNITILKKGDIQSKGFKS